MTSTIQSGGVPRQSPVVELGGVADHRQIRLHRSVDAPMCFVRLARTHIEGCDVRLAGTTEQEVGDLPPQLRDHILMDAGGGWGHEERFPGDDLPALVLRPGAVVAGGSSARWRR